MIVSYDYNHSSDDTGPAGTDKSIVAFKQNKEKKKITVNTFIHDE